MPDLGFVVFLVALSYGMGVLWYTLLGRNYTGWMRVAAFPLIGVVIGEALWAKYMTGSTLSGLVFWNLNIYPVLMFTFIAALLDVTFGWLSREHHITSVVKNLTGIHQPSVR